MQLPDDISYRLTCAHELSQLAWHTLLSTEEQERLRQFRSARRKLDFAAGRVAARMLIAERLQMRPANVPLYVAEDGAVEVEGTTLHLSISHAGDLAVAAVAERPIGADIERIVPRHPDLHRRFLNEDEVAHLGDLGLDRSEAFILCWALKEAVLKARRTGFRDSPKRLRLNINPVEQTALVRVEGDTPWVTSFEWLDGYCFAVAYQPR